MFKQIGYETGKVKRILDENSISWGYFIDHNPFVPHCNAHPNNFIVLDLFASYNKFNNLVAPLDFDMAYDYETFVCTVEESKELGKKDRESFDNWNGCEKYELEGALGGDENMINFIYSEK